jgi:hypothetical protein
MILKANDIKDLFKLQKIIKREVKGWLVIQAERLAKEKGISKYDVANGYETEMWRKDRSEYRRAYLKCHLYKNRYYFEIVCCSELDLVLMGIYNFINSFECGWKKVRYESNLYNELFENHDYTTFDILTPDNFYYMSPSCKWLQDVINSKYNNREDENI